MYFVLRTWRVSGAERDLRWSFRQYLIRFMLVITAAIGSCSVVLGFCVLVWSACTLLPPVFCVLVWSAYTLLPPGFCVLVWSACTLLPPLFRFCNTLLSSGCCPNVCLLMTQLLAAVVSLGWCRSNNTSAEAGWCRCILASIHYESNTSLSANAPGVSDQKSNI